MNGIEIAIGETPIRVESGDPAFCAMLLGRYGDFTGGSEADPIALRVEVMQQGGDAEADLSVAFGNGVWTLERGDFHASYDPAGRRGFVRQTANPWSIDAVIRIVHSLELAKTRGFLVHAASAIRNGRAFIFAGASGAGKTTISRLAPPSATLLTDEISYVRASGNEFLAWGTPFAGELGTPGANVSAPIAALYFLEHGPENRITRLGKAAALRSLLKNILFFADDTELIAGIFQTAHEFLESVEVFRLAFLPDTRVWSMIE